MTDSPQIVRLLHSLPASIRQVCSPLGSIALYAGSGLRQDGWFRSLNEMMPVNKDGDPIPWMNYPTIKFLDRNLTDDMDVFEWGSGNSTKWFADRVDTVVSIEHDPDWASHIEPELPDNSHLIIESDRQEYSSVIQETIDLAEFGGFDVVLIDGQWRVDCARAAVGSLSDDGVVLLDDATRQSYSEGRDILSKEGYDHIILEGIKPLNRNYSSTAIYYRSNNCLGI